MRVELDKMLKRESCLIIDDTNFSYDSRTEELNTSDAHMIGQKTLMRLSLLNTILNNVNCDYDIERNTLNLSKKLFNQIKNDIDYMYPHNNYEEENAHVVMQLIKRTSEDLNNFIDFFGQKHSLEVRINIVNVLLEQFKEMNNDIDYAYPNNNYEDENSHVVLQGLLGKSSSLFDLLNEMKPKSEEEQEFKQVYLEKMSGLIGLLNNGYNSSGYYQENGHDIFSELIEGLKVEIKDLREIQLKEDIESIPYVSNKVKIETDEESNKFQKEIIKNHENVERDNLDEEVPRVRNEEVKSKIKGML